MQSEQATGGIGPGELPEGTVTVLFTDVEGSTELRTREGDDVAQELLRTHERLLREQLEKHGGREVVFMGDGFMVAFGSARKAVDCAIGIQRCLEEHNKTSDRPIRVRAGLNTGEVTRESGTLYGTAVNAAARISAKAQGGQILCSQVVRDITSGVKEFRFADRGLFTLKGFPQQWRVCEILWREEGAEAPAAPAPVARGALEETYARPEIGPLVGRAPEREAVEHGLDEALQQGIRVVSVEGEAGIGKTRLMEHAAEQAAARGFGTVMVAADEELRGPFFLLRTLASSSSFQALADQATAREPLERARDVLWGRGDAAAGLAPNEQLLRIYDATSLAIRAAAEARPLALLFDDIQWADEDSLKLIRYLVRTSATSRIFLMLANRPEAGAGVTAATALIADLERMRIARRLHLPRLTRTETGELLAHILGVPVSQHCAAVLHQRGEGVPFFIVEFAQAFREAGLFQMLEGQMEVSEAARSTVPPSVQILIERRLAQLPADAREALGDAAVIGRRFRLQDLADARGAAPGTPEAPLALGERLAAAIEFNLLASLPEGAANDYAFTHDEIRNALVAAHPRARRRAIHGALVQLMEAAGAEDPARLPALAHHALEAGDAERGVRYSIEAARAALRAFAPEEAVRAVDAARAAASSPEQRADLLRLRDEALDALGRGEERLATLAEMSALARALGDETLELETALRRASAARLTDDFDQATALASSALDAATASGDKNAQLRALLELGQARMHTAMGEAFSPPTAEIDIEGAAEAYERASALAKELGDEPTFAGLRRELAIVELGRIRELVRRMREEAPDLFNMVELHPKDVPEIQVSFEKATGLVGEAVEIYERLGDRRGLMSSLIAMAYTHILDDTRHGHAGRVEQIRRLRRNLRRLTSESERAESEAHMLYSIHVYARSHGPLDLALQRGVETYETARALGFRHFEFLAAGGVALVHAMLGMEAEAALWLDRAGAAMLASPDALPARQIETWRGQVRSYAGDAAGMRTHLERALALATESGSPAGRAELLALLAQESARHGAASSDDALLSAAEAWAEEALRLVRGLPRSIAPWEAQARAALAQVTLARGDAARASEEAMAAVAEHMRIRQFFPFLFPEMWLAIARALDGVEHPAAERFWVVLRFDLQRATDETADDEIRARWLRTAIVAELVERAGAGARLGAPTGDGGGVELTEPEVELLRRVMSGQTNKEIAADVSLSEGELAASLESVFKKLGASSRPQATAAALQGGIV